jgi:glycosyltransferase involved in cell wall biosynthesis
MPSTVSVLICTRDRSGMLEGCLQSVLACSPAADEVVVVDQSRDETTRLAVCKHQGGKVPVRYLRGKGLGVSRAKNQGIADCTGDIIAFTDDDCRVDPGWIPALVEALRAGDAAAAVGRTLPGKPGEDGEETFSVYASRNGRRFHALSHPWRVGGGGNFAVVREVMRSAGPFDVRFGPGALLQSAEDMDMVHRLLRSGRRIVYAPSALVWHRSWRGREENRRLSRAYGVGAGGYFAKYLLKGDLLSGWRFLQRFGVRSFHLASGMARGDRRRVEEQSEYLKGLLEGTLRFVFGGRTEAPRKVRLEGERA